MSFFEQLANNFESEGGQIGAVVGALATQGLFGAVVGAAIGNEIQYQSESGLDSIETVLNNTLDWIEELGFETQNTITHFEEQAVYDFEYSGFEEPDITFWIQDSLYSGQGWEFWGAVGKYDSNDYFSFFVDQPTVINVSLTGVDDYNLHGDVDISLVDQNTFQNLAVSTNYGTENEYISFEVLSGAYYIDVSSYDRVTSAYALQIDASLI